ncbi:MAG: hypothetical protein ACYDH0_12395 [Candidatus Aminicenantales bacterium]
MNKGHPDSRRFVIIFLGLFIVLSLVTILCHEMWRDEFQAWLLAREQTSFGGLIRAGRYEKSPMAWSIILFLLGRLTASPLSMQLLHVGLAAVSAGLVLRFAPFGNLQKILLVFSYYLFFEYDIISRNYALGVLALLLFCVFSTRKPDKPLLPAACLFILANTSVYGLLLAFAAGAAMAAKILSDRAMRQKAISYAALFLVGAGGLLSFLFLRPVSDGSYDQVSKVHTAWNPELLSTVLRALPRAYLPMPDPTFHFWNTSILDKAPSNLPINAASALLIFVFAVALLRKNRIALAFYGLSTAGILTWSYIGSIGFARHYGHLFIAFIASLWLARATNRDTPGKASSPLPDRPKAGSKPLSGILTAVFAVGAAGGLFAAGMDIVHPFSQAKTVAGYIRQKGYAGLPIVGEMDYMMAPVSGYLGRRIYFVRGERMGSYVKWDMKRFQEVTPQLILERAEQYAWRKKKDCLILLNFHIDPRWEQPGYLTKLIATGPAIVTGEVFRLYLLKYTGPK